METIEVRASDFSDEAIKYEYEKRFGSDDLISGDLIGILKEIRFSLYMGYGERALYLVRDAVKICEESGLFAE